MEIRIKGDAEVDALEKVCTSRVNYKHCIAVTHKCASHLIKQKLNKNPN